MIIVINIKWHLILILLRFHLSFHLFGFFVSICVPFIRSFFNAFAGFCTFPQANTWSKNHSKLELIALENGENHLHGDDDGAKRNY